MIKMKKNKVIYLGLLIIIISSLLALIIVVMNYKINEGNREKPNARIDKQEVKELENIENNNSSQEIINQKIKEQGLKTNSEIYDIVKEYDGRETLSVKTSIQYKTALSGIVKRNIFKYEEIEQLLEQGPKHSGVWVEKISQNSVLELINKICKSKYNITEDGYLNRVFEDSDKNIYDQKIEKMIFSDKLYVFDIYSKTYVVNEATGIIEEYPFEEMDPEQEYEYFEDEGSYIYIIASKIQNKEIILKKIIENM